MQQEKTKVAKHVFIQEIDTCFLHVHNIDLQNMTITYGAYDKQNAEPLQPISTSKLDIINDKVYFDKRFFTVDLFATIVNMFYPGALQLV
jgi:hypothetical protein